MELLFMLLYIRRQEWLLNIQSPVCMHADIVNLTCLIVDRCRRVVELARKYDLLVVCDDVYNLLYFGENPPHRLFEFDKK